MRPPVDSKLPRVGTTIFTVMSRLAAEHGAINLSQGFPDFEPPTRLLDLANEHLHRRGAAANQYAPMTGLPRLREAIAAKVAEYYGAHVALDRIATRDPVYPAQALRNGTKGWVELAFTVTSNGSVRDIEIVAAEPRGVFDSAASDAVAAWRFRPRVVNGQPVAQRSTVTMRFDVDS